MIVSLPELFSYLFFGLQLLLRKESLQKHMKESEFSRLSFIKSVHEYQCNMHILLAPTSTDITFTPFITETYYFADSADPDETDSF